MRVLFTTLLLVSALLAPAAAQEWRAIWTEDDSWVAVTSEGEVWQLVPGNAPVSVGSFGPGPWVDFARRTQHPRSYYALKDNGEVWTRGIFGPATLWRTLPADRPWCALELDQEAGFPPQWALTCNGEIWALSDPPQLAGTFVPQPVPLRVTSWGRMKGAAR